MNKEKLLEEYNRFFNRATLDVVDEKRQMDVLFYLQELIIKELQIKKDLEQFDFYRKLKETGFRSDNIIILVEEFCVWKAKL